MEKHGSIAAKLKAALCAMCYAFIKGVTMLMLSHVFFSHLQVRRSVRSTSAASRRDAERARFKVQVPNLASKAFLSLKSLVLKAYLEVRLEFQA